MKDQNRLTIAVLTSSQDDVELINKTLRDAGNAAHCAWVKSPGAFDAALAAGRIELIMLSCERYNDTIRQVIKQKHKFQPEVPVLAMRSTFDEAAILDAMKQGASDLVSIGNIERLGAVMARELRSCHIERALNSTLQSATTYRKQLHNYMEGSANPIAYVQEGIVTDVNRAWLEAFRINAKDDIVGLPLMDYFEAESQAAVRGALVATIRGKWQVGEKLDVKASLGKDKPEDLRLMFQIATFDDGDHVQVCIAPPEIKNEEPTKLVHDALQRDPTTLFFHREQFLQRVTKRLARKTDSGLHVLAYIKPDEFRKVVAEVGVVTSEEVLAQLAEVVRKRLHPRDVAGRFEGTVIAALLERGNADDAEVWAQQLIDDIQETKFAIGQSKVSITCTVGVAPVSGAFENMDEFVAAAAQANQNGRKKGGNCVVLNDQLDDNTKIRKHDAVWVMRIKSALKERRFRLAQLPIAGLRSDSDSMVDTLIRMLDEQGEPILPSEFLPAAMRNNLMPAIDRWIIGASLDHCAKSDVSRVFVRLSTQSLRDATLPAWLESELKKRNVKGDRLCLQASEKDAARYIKPVRSLVSKFRKLGVGFALEHYGVRKSRLQILDILKPDFIKIDGALMPTLITDTELQQQVANLAEEAGNRNIETIAERVENANAMAVLFQLGINYMQGHYVHEPEVVLEDAPSGKYAHLVIANA